MMFAINHVPNVSAPQLAAAPAPAGRDELSLAAPARVAAGRPSR